MKKMSWEFIELMKKTYPAGTRVCLGCMENEPQMPQGLEGTVFAVDDIGQIQVKWDNGSTLALNVECDKFNVVQQEAPIAEQTM